MKGPGPGKGRRTAGGNDLTTALARTPAHAGGVPVPDRTPLVDDRVPGGECLLVEEAPPDVGPPAPGTGTGALLSAGGALAPLHPLAAAPLALALLRKQ